MERKYIIIGFAVIVLIVIGGIVMFNSSTDSNSLDTRSNTDSVSGNNVGVTSIQAINNSNSITLVDLGKHNTEKDCWVGFKGKAYDLTAWLPKHPGSAGAILPYCGTAKEFEDAFIKKHGEKKFGFFMKVAILMGDLTFQGNLNG
ncbi:MAG: cytochrome b5-like heme/steroid binding domain-containing protein [Nanoarchaeota archaeon]